MDVEYDKTTPAIEFSLLYNAPDMLTENDINIPRKKYTSWVIILDMFIYITMDVERNETTPAITFSTLYEDFDISAQNDVKISRKP